MADYISALNGQQMDAALTEVALYNPEAWAVGTRNGVNVTSADETYHNNAKYYAQVAQSAIPGTYTAAVRWDIAQGLAGESQEQARANISAGASNRNLLDNPWFTNPVNQRGETSYAKTSSAAIYTLDRWFLLGSSPNNIAVNSGYISVASGNNGFAQYIPTELGAALNGETVTLSVMDYAGNVSSGTMVYSNTTLVNVTGVQVDGKGCNLYCGALSGKQLGFSITTGTGNTVRIKAVKLELGSYSTLANDVPPKYDAELLSCQYRCVVYDLPGNFLFCRGIATSSTNIRGIIDLPTNMAGDKTPTISITGSLTTPQGNTITAISAANTARNNKLAVNCTVSSVTSGSAYDIFTGSATPKIVISADL